MIFGNRKINIIETEEGTAKLGDWSKPAVIPVLEPYNRVDESIVDRTLSIRHPRSITKAME